MKNKRNKRLKYLFVVTALVGVSLWGIRVSNYKRFHLEKETRYMMGTYVTIYAPGPKKKTLEAIDLALNRMQEIGVKFSPENLESPIYAFNKRDIPITDKEIIEVVRLSLEVSRASGGAFDITAFVLTELWGFNTESPAIPSEEQINDALKKTGYHHLILDHGKLKKDRPEVAIDLGGIAKGYAVGEAVKVLKAEGITSAIVDAGGDVFAMGRRGNKPWKVEIRNPREDDNLGYVEVEDLAVMGSGDYERYFNEGGERYHHIFNPTAGYPEKIVEGITVIYPDPSLADAWATALFVMGPAKGLELVEKISGLEAIMVTASNEVLYSSGLKDTMQIMLKSGE